jgi:hypothetical protein
MAKSDSLVATTENVGDGDQCRKNAETGLCYSPARQRSLSVGSPECGLTPRPITVNPSRS